MIRSPLQRLFCLLVAFALVASACGSDDTTLAESSTDAAADDPAEASDAEPSTESVTSSATAGDSWNTSAGVEAAQWGGNVTITVSDDSFRFESNGIPNHELPDQFLVPQEGSFSPPVGEDEVNAIDTTVAVVESPVDETITLSPTYVDETSDTNLGLIGVAISGAQLFNDYEDQDRSFVAVTTTSRSTACSSWTPATGTPSR